MTSCDMLNGINIYYVKFKRVHYTAMPYRYIVKITSDPLRFSFSLSLLVLFLKVQRSLKLKFEAQRRFLDGIAEETGKRTTIPKPATKHFCRPKCLPSLLTEESESNAKESESDSEQEKSHQSSEEELRSLKRLRLKEDVFSITETELSYLVPDVSFPWNFNTCLSPLMPMASLF